MSTRKKHMVSPVAAAPLPTPPRPKRGLVAGVAVGVLLGAVVGISVAAFFYFSRSKTVDLGVIALPAVDDEGPAPVPDAALFATYAGSAACRECHAKEFDAWAGSHHALAERAPDPALDKPAFDPPRAFDHGTQRTEVRSADGKFEVVAPGPGGKIAAYPVARVIGVDPLRQFLVEFPAGRVQTLEATYDPHKNQWFDVYGNEDRRPGEWGHWTGRGMNWNAQCAACHNTRVRKNYDEKSDSYQTAMAERTVSCEACHGPMKAHVVSSKALAAEAASPHAGSAASRPARRMTREQNFETCASCHARRQDLTGEFAPGDSFHDHYSLDIPNLSENFFPDGQVKEEDYEFTAFHGSKMHAAGVRCADCHEPHTGKTLLAGNNLCMRCHNGSFQGSPVIVPEAHSFHKADGAGNQCVNCHMPQTTFMQRHARHDHGFTIPDPVLTKEFNVPNACNRCHADKDAAWSIAAVDARYGAKMNRPTRERARMIANARRGDEAVREPLRRALAEERQPFWRAVAAAAMVQWGSSPEERAALLAALGHADPLVRENAVVSLTPSAQANLPGVRKALEARLADPARSVRVRAAWALRDTVGERSPAGRDLQAQLRYNGDQPAGAKAQGDYLAFRDLPRAAGYYLKAVNWEPNAAPLRDALANAMILREDTAGAAEQYGLAARLAPREPLYPYKQALAYDKLGEFDEAIATLRAAEAAVPTDARLPYARAAIHAKLGQRDAAIEASRRALQINPNFAPASDMLRDFGL